MKTFIITLVVLVILLLGGFLVYFFLKNNAKIPPATNTKVFPVEILQGHLEPIQFNGEFKDVITNGSKTTGVTSSHLDLTPYEGRNVKIEGEYSGNTMYADSITIIQ